MLISTSVSTLVLFSSLLILTSNSWVMIWILLEVNTLAFCSFMKGTAEKSKKVSDWMMKYFIIQSISSAILMFCVLSMKTSAFLQNVYLFAAISAIMIKVAAVPFHVWFITMTKSTTWKNAVVLMTWQKLAPTYLVLFMKKMHVYFFLLSTVVVSAAAQINKKVTLEILAISSVFNLGWMLITITLSTKLFFIFVTLYWSAVVMITEVAKVSGLLTSQIDTTKSFKKWMYLLTIINLAGIPPVVNFVAKVFVLNEIMKFKLLLVATFLLISSSVNFYVYLRMFNVSLMSNSMASQKKSESKKLFLCVTFILFSFTPLTAMI